MLVNAQLEEIGKLDKPAAAASVIPSTFFKSRASLFTTLLKTVSFSF